MMQNGHLKLNPGLPWQKQHSTRILFSPAKSTSICKEETSEMLIWSIALYGAETWALQKLDQKYLVSFEMWYWRWMEKAGWTDCVRNK